MKKPPTDNMQNQRHLPLKVLTVGKSFCLQAPDLYQIARILAEASRFATPRLSPYHPARQQHTSQVQPPGDNEPD